MAYEIVIGLEVHVQLLTATKLFCGCRNQFSHDPNTHICPVCLGQPGVLPVLNREAFALALRAALALNCEIPALTKFDRKHYYYPDLPKNYQISQYDMPMSQNGWLEIQANGCAKRIGITRAHIEEDAGKLVHGADASSVDLNRTGTPLLEIVSEPDLRSPEEARAYLELLKLTLQYVEVSDCNMEEGSLRCDANISIRPAGQAALGVKNEIKNMNSFRGAESALRQVAAELMHASDAGETLQQVTWGYSVDKDRIFKMRTKEEANDYRYFPEPDLPPIRVNREWVDAVRAELPELPDAKRARLMETFGLSAYDASVLVQDPALVRFFESVAAISSAPKDAANWVTNDMVREMREREIPAVDVLPVEPESLAELIQLTQAGTINRPTARQVFAQMLAGEGASPKEIVARDGLAQVSDSSAVQDVLEDLIRQNPKQVSEIEGGKTTTAMWFVGLIMRALKGKANPQVAQQVVAQRFGIDVAQMQKKKKDR